MSHEDAYIDAWEDAYENAYHMGVPMPSSILLELLGPHMLAHSPNITELFNLLEIHPEDYDKHAPRFPHLKSIILMEDWCSWSMQIDHSDFLRTARLQPLRKEVFSEFERRGIKIELLQHFIRDQLSLEFS